MRLLIIMTLFLISCSGYKIREQVNPFKKEGIESIAVPMFVNKTNLQSVSNTFSSAVISMLNTYRGLKVVTTDTFSADAVLLGIIQSQRGGYEPIDTEDRNLLSKGQIDALGSRSAFTLETVKRLGVRVHILILKKPKKSEVDFLINYFDFKKEIFPRSVFSRSFDLSSTFSVDNTFGDSSTSAPVRGTRNKGIEVYTIETQAETLAENLRGILDNAF